MRADAETLRKFVRDVFEAAGVEQHEAAIVADHLLSADLAGHGSHGVMRIPDYLAAIEHGHVIPGARLTVVSESPATAVIDGGWGFGFVQTLRALAIAEEKARSAGVGAVTVRYQGHMGRLGYYAEQSARRGFLTMLTADSGRGPKVVAPFGGADRRLGANPICFGVPCGDLPPIILDMATSAAALGKIKLARQQGDPIPEGWLIDRDGRPTTDPDAYFDGGAMVPFGGAQAHKGFGLSVIVECLSGILTGLGYGVSPDGRHNDGSLILALDVARFMPTSDFTREVADFAHELHATRPAAGSPGVLLPGEPEATRAAAQERDGVDIADSSWRALERLAEELKIPTPTARQV